MARNWDEHYQTFAPPSDPAFVVRTYGHLLPEGVVLDLAGGAGRNAFFLAALGHRVLLLEQSEVALTMVRDEVVRRGLPVHPIRADLEDPGLALPPGPFAGVVMSYFVHRPLLRHFGRLLVPDGLVLIEGFDRHEAIRRGRGESPRYWEPWELLRPPPGLSLFAFGEGRRGFAHRTFAVWRKLGP